MVTTTHLISRNINYLQTDGERIQNFISIGLHKHYSTGVKRVFISFHKILQIQIWKITYQQTYKRMEKCHL
jgi:hypothetical protein